MELSIPYRNYHVKERDQKVQRKNYFKIFKKISENFTTEKYTDVTIHCHDDQQRVFKCHRVVLASASDYFDNVFGNSDQGNVEDLQLPPSIDASTFDEVLRYVYQGLVNVVDSNVFQLLKASDVLQLSFVEECCIRYLTECKIPPNLAIEIFVFAAERKKNSLLPTASQFLLSQVDTFSQNPHFINISLEHLQRMLSHWRPSSSNDEKALVRAIFRWASRSTEAGEDTNAVSTALLNAVPLQHISREDIENSFRRLNETDDGIDVEVVAGPLENIQPTLHVFANTKLYYRYNPQNEGERRYSTYQTNLCTLRRSSTDVDWNPTLIQPTIDYMRTVACENVIYCLKKQAGSYSFSVSSSADFSLTAELSMPPVSSQQRSGFYYRDNSYLMCGNRNNIYFHDNCSPNLSMYDYNTDQWSPVPINEWNRLSVPLCMTCDDGLLYVMGSERSRGKGANKGHSMSAYDPRVGQWRSLNSGWLYHTSRDECCCHRGKIYFSCLKEEQSNYSSFGETCLKGINVYDPVAARWSSVPGTPENREMYCHRLVSFDNLLWMVSYGYGEFSGNGECITMSSYNSFTERWEYSELLDSVLVNKIYPSASRVNNVSVDRTLIDVLNFN